VGSAWHKAATGGRAGALSRTLRVGVNGGLSASAADAAARKLPVPPCGGAAKKNKRSNRSPQDWHTPYGY